MAPRKPKPQLFVNALLEATKFVALAQGGKGVETSMHCRVKYGMMIVADRVLAAGAPIIEEDLDCCPHTDRLRLALEQCGAEHSIVQQADTLYVRSGEFSAYVPLCGADKLGVAVPDPPEAALGDTFRAALKVTGSLVKESAATVLQSCIQLNAGSCVATNGSVILEAWHGFDMPPGLLIPKQFAEAVCKIQKKIVSFGFSKPTGVVIRTFTVHFEDRSWIRTNLYSEKVPDIVGKLAVATNMRQLDPMFFTHVAEIAKWSEDGKVYLTNGQIASHPNGAVQQGGYLAYPLPNMRQDVSYSIASLKQVSKLMTHFDDGFDRRAMFFAPHLRLRGAVACESTLPVVYEHISDDDIPF